MEGGGEGGGERVGGAGDGGGRNRKNIDDKMEQNNKLKNNTAIRCG